MPLTYTYTDAYLTRLVTDALEARALEDVGVMAGARTFSAAYTERLTVLQAYVLASLDHQADAEDLFTVKLKSYRDQMSVVLGQAIIDADTTSETVTGFSLFSIPLERA